MKPFEHSEPFTLGWWLENLSECYFRKESISIDRVSKGKYHGIMVESDELALKYQRYDNLSEFIEVRIIKEYGCK